MTTRIIFRRAHIALRPDADGSSALRALLHAATLADHADRRPALVVTDTTTRAGRTSQRASQVHVCTSHGLPYLTLTGMLATQRQSARLPQAPRRVPWQVHTAAGCGLSATEQQSLTESLARTDAAWPAFASRLAACGWREAAMNIEHACGASAVRLRVTNA